MKPKKQPNEITMFIPEEKDPKFLIDIIKAIENYYYMIAKVDELDSSEEWKREAGMITKPIPEEVDELVKTAFVKQLKRYT